MQIYKFTRLGERPERLTEITELPSEGFVWLDFTRSQARDWPSWAQRLAGVTVNEAHIIASFNGNHPSVFGHGNDYEMVIFQGLTPEDCESTDNLIVTKSAAFFIFDNLLITLRAAENVSFDVVKRNFCEVKLRFPSTPFGLIYVVLDTMVDRYFAITDELEDRLEHISDLLLNPKSDFNDWQPLMRFRKQSHALELLCEKNLEAIDAWQRGMHLETTENQRIRLFDLREHIQRVMHHADSLQRDTEAAIQLHFSVVSHRTNQIMQVLTVLSAIFFPLTLLTGIWGMNFKHMPELDTRYGYFFALALIIGFAGMLLMFFKKRRFF